MDHAEEQRQEIEVLESMYADDFVRTSDTSFDITLRPDDAYADAAPALVLSVAYPPTYPEVVPECTLRPRVDDGEESAACVAQDLLDEWIAASLGAAAEASLGMAMVFTIASEVGERLNAHLADAEARAKAAEEDAYRKLQEEETKRYMGAPVTLETFSAWLENYKVHLAEIRAKEEAAAAAAAKRQGRGGNSGGGEKERLTGRQLFERGLIVEVAEGGAGDDDGGEVVNIDMSVFEQEMDNLGLSDSDEDDE